MRRLLLLALLSLPAAAADPPAATASPAPTAGAVLRVRPQLCIVDRFANSCESVFQIYWRSQQGGDYCLDTDQQPSPLQCWSQADKGDWRERRSVEQDFLYRLTEGKGGPALATAKVQVLRIDNPDRRRQRRGRHVWDVL
jgi:hypothetical protein